MELYHPGTTDFRFKKLLMNSLGSQFDYQLNLFYFLYPYACFSLCLNFHYALFFSSFSILALSISQYPFPSDVLTSSLPVPTSYSPVPTSFLCVLTSSFSAPTSSLRVCISSLSSFTSSFGVPVFFPCRSSHFLLAFNFFFHCSHFPLD